MGKGRIISAHGEGRYTLEIVEDRARAESARALAVQRVSELDGRISELDQQIGAAQADVDAAAAAQNAAIEQYRFDMAETGESDIDLGARAQAVLDAAADRDRLRTQQRLLETQRAAAQSRIDRIDALPPLRQIEAWCADYTEDLSGEVATAEVPGEIGQVIIKPGFQNGAAWSPVVDGAIQPALAGTPASVFYNLSMLPGWQRWRPTFRIATISNIDNDLCDIALDPATSSQQGLNVNAKGSYTGVPIMYMDCNGDAFEDGDRVLVAFSGSTDQPMVVGFEQEPRECGFEFFTRHRRWWDSYGEYGNVGLFPNQARALIFRIEKGFSVNKIMYETAHNMYYDEGIFLCRLSADLAVTEVVSIRWRGPEDGTSIVGFIEDIFDFPVYLMEGDYYALVGVKSNRSGYGAKYEYYGFRYGEFSEEVSSHIMVIMPSSDYVYFCAELPATSFENSIDENRELLLSGLTVASFIECESAVPAPLPGFGINDFRFG